MHPELFGMAAGTIFLGLASLVGSAVAVYVACRAGFIWWRFLGALLVLKLAAPLGAKAYGLIERQGVILPLSAELVSGYRYPGGLIAVVVALWALGKWTSFSPAVLADVITPSFGFALSVARIGCILGGCCSGSPSDLPWAIQFPVHSILWNAQVRAGILPATATTTLPVHPLQGYFALLAFSLGCFCLWFERRKAYDGQVFLIFVSIYGAGQFLLEFIRFSPLPHVQYMALLAGLVAGAALLWKMQQPVLRQRIA
jgi:phosphatidylglycerol---prolipoprotein diacylglyceryl transferase